MAGANPRTSELGPHGYLGICYACRMARTKRDPSSSPPQPDQPVLDEGTAPEEQALADEAAQAMNQAPQQAANPSSVPALNEAASVQLTQVIARVDAAREALRDALITRDALPQVQFLREGVLALLADLDRALDKGKGLLAEAAEAVVILEPRQFAVPNRGNIMHARGHRVERKRHPEQFAAIVAQLTCGKHFTFA